MTGFMVPQEQARWCVATVTRNGRLEIHVFKVGPEEKEHTPDKNCWCEPAVGRAKKEAIQYFHREIQ